RFSGGPGPIARIRRLVGGRGGAGPGEGATGALCQARLRQPQRLCPCRRPAVRREAMTDLLVKPHPRDKEGCVLSVTPESAGWHHVGFAVFTLQPGERLGRRLPEREACIVPLCGRADVAAGDATFAGVGGRTSPFDGK